MKRKEKITGSKDKELPEYIYQPTKEEILHRKKNEKTNSQKPQSKIKNEKRDNK